VKKFTNFERIKRDGWPDPKELKSYFFAPPGQEWFHTVGTIRQDSLQKAFMALSRESLARLA
jgi:hypothetical protein